MWGHKRAVKEHGDTNELCCSMLKAFLKEDGSKAMVYIKMNAMSAKEEKKKEISLINMMDLTLEPCERGQK